MNENPETKNNPGKDHSFPLKSLPWKRILLSAAIGLAVLFLLFLGLIWYLIASAPDIDSITVSPLESATYICDENGTYLRRLTFAASNRDIIPLEEIPETLQNAIVAIEDERFYEHGGIDLRGIARAFWKGITSGSFSEGASTITQQLIKNSVFTEWTLEDSFYDRFRRKVQEQYLALQLENRMEKQEILEHYLNTINLGAGCYGVQAAAQRYFGKNAADLTLSESAVLASIPQNPSAYNPIRYPEANYTRAQTVLNYMADQNLITEEEKEAAMNDNVYERILAYDDTYEEETAYSYYEDALIDQVTEALVQEKGWSQEQAYRAVYSGGLRIFSAQDSYLQEICDQEFSNPSNFPAGTTYGIDYALSIADENGLVTHYGTEALRLWVRENLDASFYLLCDSEEEAQTYTDAFREAMLAEFRRKELISESEADNNFVSRVSVIAERLSLSPQPQASLVIIDQTTGYVRALVGGRGEKKASLTLNRATETTRQPGSTFKILTAYAPALDAFGKTLISEYENTPFRYDNGTAVSNWDINDYSGNVTIREAITRSINVAAVRCITEITPQVGFEYARQLGITTLHESYETANGVSSDIIQPLALGGVTQGVTALELCNAYAAIANGGIYRTPKFFTKILDRHGAVVLDYTEESESSVSPAVFNKTADSASAGTSPQDGSRVLQESTSFLLTDAMEDVVSSSSGTAYGSISAAGQPVAGKTGTTSNYKDIWFVGYTPYYTCCVWGGYDNNQDLANDSVSHSYSKILWSAVMDRAHRSLPAAEFSRPDSVVPVTLCKESHALPVDDACPETYTEYFAKGTEPEDLCPLHEPEPETEPIYIYPELLDQLTTESESASEMESASESESSAESEPPAESAPPADSESAPETLPDESEQAPSTESESDTEFPSSESESSSETGTVLPSGSSEMNSLDDLLMRLTEVR